MQNTTIKKRIIISLAWISFFVVIGLILYYFITPDATCFDGKKNQAEKEVDCGGTCSPCREIVKAKDVIINETAVVFGGNKSYDAIAKITNPNDSVGSSFFEYTFNLKDENGKVIGTRKGSNFILPADSKYIADLGIEIIGDVLPKSAEFIVSKVTWEQLSDVGKPQIGIYGKSFKKAPLGIGNEAEGILRNESLYDLNKIFLVIVLRGDNGEIVGVNKTEKNFVRNKAEMDFRISWPYQFSAPVQNMEVDAQSNVFDRQNFSFSL